MSYLPATKAKLTTGMLVKMPRRGKMGKIEKLCIHDPDNHGNTWCGSYFVRYTDGTRYRELAEDLIPVSTGGF